MDERVLGPAPEQKSYWILIWTIIFVILVIPGVIMLVSSEIIGGVIYIVSVIVPFLFILYWILLYYSSMKFSIRGEHLIVEKRVCGKKKPPREILFESIKNVDKTRNPFEQYCKIGKIHVQTAGDGGKKEKTVIQGIKDLDKVMKEIKEMIRNKKGGWYLFSIDTKFEEELNNDIISEELKKEFEKYGFSLPDNAAVKKEKEKKWAITDEKKVIIRKEEGKLNIYGELKPKVNEAELFNNLRMEYKEVHSYWRILTDIRFKLLAFVPTLVGLGLALLSKIHKPLEAFAIGLLGFIVTLGITFYDQRNSQLYDASIARAKYLERKMNIISSDEKEFGGIFCLRPGRTLKFLGITIWHDRALAMVYASALGAWLFIIINSILKRISWPSETFSLLLSVLLAIVIYIFLPKDTETSGEESQGGEPQVGESQVGESQVGELY